MQDQILFITGDTLAPETLEFLEPNRLPYVAKPFLVEELKSAVNRQLDANRKSPRRAPAEFSRGQVCGEIKTSEK
jgi:DNA-binding response OmpR family regulator